MIDDATTSSVVRSHVPWRERLVAAVLRRALRALLRPTLRAGLPIVEQRRRLERVSRFTLATRGCRIEAGACGDVPGEFVRPTNGPDPVDAILYLHGGAYCLGSAATHRAFTTALARDSGALVFVPNYRLAPEHAFPAAVDDAVAAYRGLLVRGCAPGRIAIAGDSAGGGLAFATAVQLRRLNVSLPAAIVAFSPWGDLSDTKDRVVPPGEVMISPAWLEECARLYLGDGDAREPLASPVYADLAGLPPTLIQVGTDEALLQDSRRLQAALAAAGVRSQLVEYAGRWHVFQLNVGVLADADRALTAAVAFMRERWRQRTPDLRPQLEYAAR